MRSGGEGIITTTTKLTTTKSRTRTTRTIDNIYNQPKPHQVKRND
jgi:hypothetical protein